MQGMVLKNDYSTLDELNQNVNNWLDTQANVRDHATTHERPYDRWLKEKQSLHILKNYPRYQTSPFTSRYSTQDGMVQYKSNFYSVPLDFSRRKLFIKEINTNGLITLEIFFEDILVTTHQLTSDRGKWIVKDEHLTKIKRGESNLRSKTDSIVIIKRGFDYYNNLIPIHG